MRKLFITLLAGLCYVQVAAAQDEPIRQISFRQAVQLASEQNILLKQQQNQLVTLSAERTQSTMAYLPNVNANVSGGLNYGQQSVNFEDEVRIVNSQTEGLSGSINANLTLFDGFSRVYDKKIADYNYQSQMKGVNRTRQDITFQVAQQYLQILLDQQLLKIAQENIENQSEQLKQIQGFVKSGLRAPADEYNQLAELKRLEVAKIEAQNKLAIDKATLSQTLQLDPLEEFTVMAVENLGEIDREALGLATMFDLALSNREDYKQLSYQKESTVSAIESAKSGYYPSLSMYFQYGSRYTSAIPTLNFNEQFFDLSPNTSVGLNLSIPIFNNYRNKTNVARAKVSMLNNNLDLENLKRTIYRDVQNAYLNYQTAIKRLEASEARVEASRQAFKVQNQRYDLGAANLVELSQANQGLVQAESDYAQAQYTLLFQKVILDYNTGSLAISNLEEN